MEFKPPADFCLGGNNAENWRKWLREFNIYMEASEKTSKPSKQKVAILLNLMGPEAMEIYDTFLFDRPEEKYDFDKVIDKYQQYFEPRKNIVFERSKFLSRKQQEGESIDNFILDLRKLAEPCEFGGQKDSMIRDRLVLGIQDKSLQERLLREPDLQLEKAVEFCKITEDTRKQRRELERGHNEVSTVVRRENREKQNAACTKQVRPREKRQVRPQEKWECKRCGYSHKPRQCPAWGKRCKKCGKGNHFASMCRSQQNFKQNLRIVNTENEKNQEYVISGLELCEGASSDRWTKIIAIGKNTLAFKVDCGADVTVVPEKCPALKGIKMLPSKIKLFGPSREKLQCVGMMQNVELTFGEKSTRQDIYVVKGLSTPLLGRPALEELEIIKLAETVEKSEASSSLIDDYPELFRGLGTFQGDEYKIETVPGSRPFAITTPRTVPVPLMKQVQEELQRMQKLGVISPVTTPTEWCHPMVVVRKPSGQVRICVDLTRLNKSVKREVYPIPKIENTLARLANAKYFSKLDANSGFWQVPLAEESKLLTTFLTPFGRFYFHRLPFGITSAPEHFQRRMQDVLQGITGVICHMDDILVWGSTRQEHDNRLRLVLEKLKQKGMTLNKEKIEICKQSIKFLGHILSNEGVKVDPEKVKAVVEMESPKNRAELQRFLGMITFMGSFIPNKSDVMAPLNSLLSEKTTWIWDKPQETAFTTIKSLLATAPTLALFDPGKKTIISADASSYGLGAVLFQIQEDNTRRPVAYASRTLSSAEQKYAQIEREALALTWACQRFEDYITGLMVVLETDHKPLVPIMSSKNLDDLSPRLQRFRIRLMRYSYEIVHIPGKQLVLADTLSRKPLSKNGDNAEGDELAMETNAFVKMIVSNLSCTDERLKEIWTKQQEDPVCRILEDYALNGWPTKSSLPFVVKPFYPQRSEITSQDGLLMRGCRLIIPEAMRGEILKKLHEGHLGITKCRARARQTCWWPKQSSEIEQMIRNCPQCVQHHTNKHEPLIPTPFPDKPWQRVATDLFKCHGQWYMVVIDYFSRYPEVEKLRSLNTKEIIDKLEPIFARFGVPEVMVSDRGPQFQALETADFAKFAKEYGFRHIRSSPHFPQSNGMAEAGVKIVKNRIKKCNGHNLQASLLAYRATPLENGYSPAELLLNKKIRTKVPIASQLLVPQVPNLKSLKNKEYVRREQQKRRYDRRHGAKEMPELANGQHVWITDLRTHGYVLRKDKQPRSYIIETDNGTICRNRFHLVSAPYDLPVSSSGEYTDLNDVPLSEKETAEQSNPKKAVVDAQGSVYTRSGRLSKKPQRYCVNNF